MNKTLTKQIRDQAAHCTVAFLALLIFGAWPNILTGALCGFVLGMIREVTEEGEVSWAAVSRALDSKLDLTFWTIGGALAGLIL